VPIAAAVRNKATEGQLWQDREGERHGFQPCRLQQHSPQRDAGAAYLAELALGFDGRGHPSPTWFVALRTKAGSSAAKIIRFANDLLRSE
jgi:hypothetical protein